MAARLAASTVGLEKCVPVTTIDLDEAMNAAFPARRFAEAVIVTTDGERFVSARTEARGDPEIPLDDAALAVL